MQGRNYADFCASWTRAAAGRCIASRRSRAGAGAELPGVRGEVDVYYSLYWGYPGWFVYCDLLFCSSLMLRAGETLSMLGEPVRGKGGEGSGGCGYK